MKQFLFFLAIVIAVFPSFAIAQSEERIELNKAWKFIPGDNLAFASPTFDDSRWRPIQVDKIWEQQGYDPMDGFAWFRFRVVIPSRLKEKSFLKDSLVLFLGKINNFDQTFLNGAIIGINAITVTSDAPIDTSFLKAKMEMWNIERRYALAVDDPRIKWDQENVIAVRVFDQGGQGGMYTGNQCIKMVTLDDYLLLDSGSEPFVQRNGKLAKTMTIRNISTSRILAGTLTMRAQSKLTQRILLNQREKLMLPPRTEKRVDVALRRLDESTTLEYRFDFSGTNARKESREETPYILTPPPSKKPKINCARVFGARPGNPFLFTVATSGERPMKFEARGLPNGLTLDPASGIITGIVGKRGEYSVEFTAQNRRGKATAEVRFVIGDTIALTPPLGWNSWNCWGLAVDEEKVLASARAFKQKGLMDHGWSYINIDDGWEIKGDSPEPKRLENGKIITNEKFTDMRALGDSIHALGLKFGIYSSPGPLTCGGYTATYQHEQLDAESYASWGIDYLKYDWCSYEKIAKDTSRAELMKPYRTMQSALKTIRRDIVYSLCQYGMGKVWEWGAEVGGNLWRTTGDITDTWESMREIGFNQVSNAPFAGPGHWNDPDMLVVGWVGWGPNLHPTKLTPDEQYTHLSLWSLLSAPLLIGCDLQRLDDFTLNLLTNDEVLAIDQDPLGKQATPVVKSGDVQVWVKELADGSKAVGMFNLGSNPVRYSLDLVAIGISGSVTLRDVWRQKNLGRVTGSWSTAIPSHGVVLLRTK